jgi:hypothetical protein
MPVRCDHHMNEDAKIKKKLTLAFGRISIHIQMAT